MLLSSLALLVLAGCSRQEESTHVADAKPTEKVATVARNTQGIAALKWVEAGETYNPEAPIPSQCYTKTDQNSNPCYVCHQSYPTEQNKVNSLNDGFLQGTYAFSDEGLHNSWVNLFQDRRPYIDSVSDEEIETYVNTENYTALIAWMNQNGWEGDIPYLENLHLGAEAFFDNGLAKDGSRWVAFNYKPLPSTFWPTNGSTDDVMIRLPAEFSSLYGEFSEDVYFANLSLLELAIQGRDEISTLDLNEALLDRDLDGDGILSQRTNRIQKREFFVGDASEIEITDQLYPVGTEFLHTVRYIGNHTGELGISLRMKELRYLRKKHFIRPKKILGVHYAERKEKHFENLPLVADYGDEGMGNRHGWVMWGFIEDAEGELRKQHFEEQFFCVGCHKSVGTTIDQTFSFPRKLSGREGWGYIDLSKIIDVPNVGERDGEYLTYLERVGGGDEFRQNEEMLARWFDEDGRVKAEEVAMLDSIYPLIMPSQERAHQLNKAYQAIVKEQSYIYGRDVNIKPAINVHRDVDATTKPLKPEFRYEWDIRLDWEQ